MKWLLTTGFVLLVPSTSAEVARPDNLRKLKRNTDTSYYEQPAVASAAEHTPQLFDERSKSHRLLAHAERKKERENDSLDGSSQSRSARNRVESIVEISTVNTEVTTTEAPGVTVTSSTTSAEVTTAATEEPTVTSSTTFTDAETEEETTTATEPTAVSSTATTRATSTASTTSLVNWDNNDTSNVELTFSSTATPAFNNSDNEIAHMPAFDDIAHLQYSSKNLHVHKLYTYGAPSVVKGSSTSNPNNACIPGLRIFTEDVKDVTCYWYSVWCTPGRQVTNVDFASQINVKEGYHHPNMPTLIIRLVDGEKVEYTYQPCQSYENTIEPYQWWPEANLPGGIIQNNHYLVDHYEPRLMQVPYSVRGPSLEYISAAMCLNAQTFDETDNCLNNYNQETPSKLDGVYRSGWETFAYMNHKTTNGIVFTDVDQVFVLKNDGDANRRQCIIGFQAVSHGLNAVMDFTNFVNNSNDATSYCGRSGVHDGIKNELWKITDNPRYASVIVPALETCHDVTCVGHSLGGALCNLFTMCANQRLENLDESHDAQTGWDDYKSLIWTKKKAD